MKKIILSVSEDMLKVLEEEKKRAAASSLQELIRQILSDWVRKNGHQ